MRALGHSVRVGRIIARHTRDAVELACRKQSAMRTSPQVLVALNLGGARAMSATTMRAFFAEDGKAVMKHVPMPTPGPGEVLLKVEASGVNRADCVQRSGNYPPPPGASDILGLEVVGLVHSVGAGVSEHVIGERFMSILSGGGYADYCIVPEATLIQCPGTWGKAGKIPTASDLCVAEAWLTAYQLLMLVGKVQEGEVVLVHAGASSVGMAIIQTALHVAKAIPVVTCSGSKVHAVREIGAQEVIDRNADDGRWVEAVKKAANNLRRARGLPEKKGVELVLDPVGGAYWSQNAAALAVDGRLVVYGLMGGAKVKGIILGDILSKRLQVIGTTIRMRSTEYKAEVARRFSTDVLPHLADGTLSAPVYRTMPLDEAEEAMNVMMSNANLGKIVLIP